MTNATALNTTLETQITEWRKPFEAFAAEEIGTSNVVLDQTTCQEKECKSRISPPKRVGRNPNRKSIPLTQSRPGTLGDFMSDAMLASRRNATPAADFALINAGGIRSTIDAGPITRGEVITSFPFGNSLVELTLPGATIWNVLEGIVSATNQDNQKPVTSFLQLSTNIRVAYAPAAPVGSRLVTVDVAGASLDLARDYRVVTLDFIAGGGDNFFAEPIPDFVVLDTQEDVLADYIRAQSPVDVRLDGRITVVDGNGNGNGTQAQAAKKPSGGAVQQNNTAERTGVGMGVGGAMLAGWGAWWVAVG
jgi:5'-nucleotidase